MKRLPIALLVLFGSHLATAASTTGGYHLLKKVPVPGDSGYDYLTIDDDARRLYVSHGAEVAVLDADSLAPVGKLAGLAGVHGIAIVPELGKGFITEGKGNTVTIFDLKTLETLGKVTTGKNPDAITYDPASHRIFSINHSGGNVTVIDPTDDKVTATIQIGGALEFARADGNGSVWVNVEDTSEVVHIDSKKMAVTAHWPLAPCEEPTGMALDKKNRRLFIGCGNEKMAVMNADTGKVITTLPIGPGVDGTDFDPATGDIFNSCGGDGTLPVVHQDGADKYHAVETVKTQPQADG